jgi:hypothetical protein
MDENSPTSNPPPDDDDDFSEPTAAGHPQPADSPITIERFPDGVTIQIPPAGLWRGSHGLFAFGLIWLGITAPLFLCIGCGVLGGQADAKGDPGILWALPLMMSIFLLVGIGLLLGGINMGTRKAALAVTGGSLMVLQTGIFGSKQRQWPPGDVEAIRTGPSGMTVNDKPVLELQIFDGGAAKFGLLAGRSDEELEWLAAELRGVLRVPSIPS